MLEPQAQSPGRRFSMCLSTKLASLDTTFVKDNSLLAALLLSYVAIVMLVMRLVPKGQAFLQIYWFDPITFSLGIVFSLLCLLAQYLFPKLHPPFTLKNYLQFFLIVLLLPPYKSAFASYKQFISAAIPYRWDVTFMQLDKLLHFGHMPWQLLDVLVVHKQLLALIDVIYLLWFVMLIAFSLWMGITTRAGLRKRYFITTIIIWSIFGSGLGSVFYSVGPCYYASVTGEAGPYAPLLDQLEQVHAESTLLAVRNEHALWQAHVERHWLPFGGISAMPSVHVAMAILFALVLGEAYPLLRLTGWIFALFIQVGSIVLAWHYAVDGYASAILTVIVWKALSWREARKALAPNGFGSVTCPSWQ